MPAKHFLFDKNLLKNDKKVLTNDDARDMLSMKRRDAAEMDMKGSKKMKHMKTEHKKLSRILLGAGLGAGLGGLMVFLLYLFALVQTWGMFLWYVSVLTGLGMCAAAMLYGLALMEYLHICLRIGEDRSFCRENAMGLCQISRYLLFAAGLWLLAQGAALLPGIGAGSWMIAFLLFALASAAMGVLAWAIGRLLARAVQIKEENDLTV